MKKKKIIILSIVIIGLLLIVTGVTYSILSFRVEGTEVNIVKAGILKIDIDENEPITLLEAYPISTDKGMEGEPYTFTVSNTGDIDAIYRIYLDDVQLDAGIERLSDSSIRYSLTKDGKYLTDTVADLLSDREDRIIDNGAIYPGETFNYELKMWIDENVGNEEQGKAFKGKIRIEGEQLINDTCFTVSNGTITGYSNTCSKDVIIPSKINGITITTIGGSAFANKGLTSVVFPNTLTTITRGAFNNNQLTNLDIPSSVTSIAAAFNNNQLSDEDAFIYGRNPDGSENKTLIVSYGGAKRENVVIPEGVVSIGSLAFSSNELVSVQFPSTLKTIRDQAFKGNLLTSLDIPSNVTNIWPNAFNNNQLPDDEAFIYKRNSDGSEDRTTLISYGGAKRENVVIPEGVEIIDSAFTWINVTSVVMPSTLKTITNRAFAECALTSLDIPSSVTYIAPGTFNKNQLPDDEAFIFQRKADGSIDDTILVSYGGANRNNIIIPDTARTISGGAFTYVGMKEIVIPENVETIEASAFNKNTWSRNLSKIINKTGKAFDWGLIINNVSGYNFVTGTVYSQYGNVEIVSE